MTLICPEVEVRLRNLFIRLREPETVLVVVVVVVDHPNMIRALARVRSLGDGTRRGLPALAGGAADR